MNRSKYKVSMFLFFSSLNKSPISQKNILFKYLKKKMEFLSVMSKNFKYFYSFFLKRFSTSSICRYMYLCDISCLFSISIIDQKDFPTFLNKISHNKSICFHLQCLELYWAFPLKMRRF